MDPQDFAEREKPILEVIYSMISCIQHSRNDKIPEMESRLVIARGSRQRWAEHGQGREESIAINGSMRDAWDNGNVLYLVCLDVNIMVLIL